MSIKNISKNLIKSYSNLKNKIIKAVNNYYNNK